MAKTNVTALESATARLCVPTPFAIEIDSGYMRPGCEMEPAALQVNPMASVEAILGAATRRADMLNKMLLSWACCRRDGDISASEIAEALQPAAEEVVLLLPATMSRVSRVRHEPEPDQRRP